MRLVLDERKTVGAVARDLDLTSVSPGRPGPQGHADRTEGRTGLTGVGRKESARLRRDVRELRAERDALSPPRPSSRKTPVKFAWIHVRRRRRPQARNRPLPWTVVGSAVLSNRTGGRRCVSNTSSEQPVITCLRRPC